jgi:hypothetical protein
MKKLLVKYQILTRLKYLPQTLVVAILGGMIAVTPIVGWLFPGKSWLFSALVYYPTLSSLSESSEERPPGLKLWDVLHPWIIPISAIVLTFGTPLFAWLNLGLSAEWDKDTLDSRLPVVQLIVSILLGTVALQAFGLFQLPSLIKPRVSTRFLANNESNSSWFYGEIEYTGRFAKSLDMDSRDGMWLHIRVTNVGIQSYRGLSVGVKLPEQWDSMAVRHSSDFDRLTFFSSDGKSKESLPDQPKEHMKPYGWNQPTQTIEFDPNENPRETGPGDGGVYSFWVKPPDYPLDDEGYVEDTTYVIKVIIRSHNSSAAAVTKLKLKF